MSDLLQIDHLVKKFPVSSGISWLAQLRGKTQVPHLLHAVDDVSFEIRKGESIGLVGESGCGKSTLVRLVTRLLDPTEGGIRFEGRQIGLVAAKNFASSPDRATIQMVFQDPTDSLNPRYSAFDTIAEPIRLLGEDRDRQNLPARVHELAAAAGLPQELLARFPHQLSGGQKARVGIARAISLRPKLLILDEPTAALDVSVQAIILHLLADLREQLGMSYLFVSHDLNIVRLLCDRVLVMYLGKIVESGPAEAMFANPLHPYTRALIEAIPQPAGKRAATRISGEPQSPIDPDPNVCRFYGRCPKGERSCHESAPALRPFAGERWVACHFPELHTAIPEKTDDAAAK